MKQLDIQTEERNKEIYKVIKFKDRLRFVQRNEKFGFTLLSRRIQERCQSCEYYKEKCKGTSLEMELFRQKEGYNPYCRVDNK